MTWSDLHDTARHDTTRHGVAHTQAKRMAALNAPVEFKYRELLNSII